MWGHSSISITRLWLYYIYQRERVSYSKILLKARIFHSTVALVLFDFQRKPPFISIETANNNRLKLGLTATQQELLDFTSTLSTSSGAKHRQQSAHQNVHWVMRKLCEELCAARESWRKRERERERVECRQMAQLAWVILRLIDRRMSVYSSTVPYGYILTLKSGQLAILSRCPLTGNACNRCCRAGSLCSCCDGAVAGKALRACESSEAVESCAYSISCAGCTKLRRNPQAVAIIWFLFCHPFPPLPLSPCSARASLRFSQWMTPPRPASAWVPVCARVSVRVSVCVSVCVCSSVGSVVDVVVVVSRWQHFGACWHAQDFRLNATRDAFAPLRRFQFVVCPFTVKRLLNASPRLRSDCNSNAESPSVLTSS